MAGLEIVWRNPDPPHHQQRWEQLTAESQASLYEIQEFVSLTDGGFWSASSRLKVLAGGRVRMAERPELNGNALSVPQAYACQRNRIR